MTDKPDDKATSKAPEKVDEAKRKADIYTEYQTLMSQDQDEISIVKALCSKHGLDQVALGDLIAEARKNPPKAPAPASPAHGAQGAPRPDSHK